VGAARVRDLREGCSGVHSPQIADCIGEEIRRIHGMQTLMKSDGKFLLFYYCFAADSVFWL